MLSDKLLWAVALLWLVMLWLQLLHRVRAMQRVWKQLRLGHARLGRVLLVVRGATWVAVLRLPNPHTVHWGCDESLYLYPELLAVEDRAPWEGGVACSQRPRS